MLDQILLSPHVKGSMIICNKHQKYELPTIQNQGSEEISK